MRDDDDDDMVDVIDDMERVRVSFNGSGLFCGRSRTGNGRSVARL